MKNFIKTGKKIIGLEDNPTQKASSPALPPQTTSDEPVATAAISGAHDAPASENQLVKPEPSSSRVKAPARPKVLSMPRIRYVKQKVAFCGSDEQGSGEEGEDTYSVDSLVQFIEDVRDSFGTIVFEDLVLSGLSFADFTKIKNAVLGVGDHYRPDLYCYCSTLTIRHIQTPYDMSFGPNGFYIACLNVIVQESTLHTLALPVCRDHKMTRILFSAAIKENAQSDTQGLKGLIITKSTIGHLISSSPNNETIFIASLISHCLVSESLNDAQCPPAIRKYACVGEQIADCDNQVMEKIAQGFADEQPDTKTPPPDKKQPNTLIGLLSYRTNSIHLNGDSALIRFTDKYSNSTEDGSRERERAVHNLKNLFTTKKETATAEKETNKTKDSLVILGIMQSRIGLAQIETGKI
mgnify:CR=1 FL=1